MPVLIDSRPGCLVEGVDDDTPFITRYGSHRRVSLLFPDDGLSHQSFADECDINTVLSKYMKTGVLPEGKSNPQYGDFSSVGSYQESLNIVARAEEQFMSLDATLRQRFDNDPAQFLAFTSDPNSVDEMVRLGLATERSAKTDLSDDSDPVSKKETGKKTKSSTSSPAVGEGPKS